MNQTVKAIRKAYGLPAFERECRLTPELGRMKLAYKVPGTREHGAYRAMIDEIERKYNREIAMLCSQ